MSQYGQESMIDFAEILPASSDHENFGGGEQSEGQGGRP
jgi:hypothetical protein